MGDFNTINVKGKKIIIVKAATGAGKSVSLPRLMYFKGYKKIAITEPRIFNVRNFFKEYTDSKGIIHPEGYLRMRFPDIKFGESTSLKHDTENKNIIYYTEESFINVFENQINKIDILIIDEIHVNSLSTEVLMTLYKEKLLENPNLRCKLILTSATLSKNKLINFFDDIDKNLIEYYEISGTQGYNQEEIYLPKPVSDFTNNIIEIIKQNINNGNILIFLPSVSTIKSIHGLIIKEFNNVNFHIYELYRGSSDLETFETKRQSIYLATNIAETGITLDPLSIVIDSGWTNIKFYNPNNDYTTMLKQPISDDDRIQRKGRIGRTSQGKIYYLYTQGSVKPSNYYSEKELSKSDYSLLRGLQDIPEEQKERSIQNLYFLGAFNKNLQKTFIGDLMLKLNIKNINYCKLILSSIINKCCIPIISIICMENIDTKETIYNNFLCDFWAKWILFKSKYCKDPTISALFTIYINKINKINKNYDSVLEAKELSEIDDEKLYSRIKKCIISGYYFNTAKKIDKNIYQSVINPEIKGTLSSPYYPTRFNDLSIFPNQIIYEMIILNHYPDGSSEFNFVNILPIK